LTVIGRGGTVGIWQREFSYGYGATAERSVSRAPRSPIWAEGLFRAHDNRNLAKDWGPWPR